MFGVEVWEYHINLTKSNVCCVHQIELLKNRRTNDKYADQDGKFPPDYKPKRPELPSLQEFLDLRLNENVFEIFCDKILRCVVGKLVWRERICHELVSVIATPSDEALALLILENSWDRWEQIYDLDGDHKNAKIQTKWTSDPQHASPFSGWNLEGRERFNELRRLVINDRKGTYCQRVEEHFREKKQERSSNKKRKKECLQELEYECEDDFHL